jgi:hypothetical protein
MEPQPPPDAPWNSGIQGARANLWPAAALQLFALCLVLGYYYQPGVHSALAHLAEVRQRTGVAFGIASTALFGGILPFAYISLTRSDHLEDRRSRWIKGLCLTAFWAYKGLEVGLWYRLQAYVVGGGHEATTIAIKVFLDQLVYCPVLAVPVTVLVYQAVEMGFDWPGLRADVRAPSWYRRRVLPVLISNLGVWVPAVAVIYCLPTALQLPLQNIVLCFYTLIVAHQARTGLTWTRVGSPTKVPGQA